MQLQALGKGKSLAGNSQVQMFWCSWKRTPSLTASLSKSFGKVNGHSLFYQVWDLDLVCLKGIHIFTRLQYKFPCLCICLIQMITVIQSDFWILLLSSIISISFLFVNFRRAWCVSRARETERKREGESTPPTPTLHTHGCGHATIYLDMPTHAHGVFFKPKGPVLKLQLSMWDWALLTFRLRSGPSML